MLSSRPFHRRMHATAAALLALAAAACSDRGNPVAPAPGPGPTGPPGAPVTVQALECTGDRVKLTVSCSPSTPSGDRGPAYLIVGGQNQFVKVSTANTAYNNGTGAFTFDLNIRNLIPQPLGTTDGTTLDPAGVRLFFIEGSSLPVLAGTGTVTVGTADGTGTFTAAGQPYYQYNEVLSQYELSPTRQWQLNMPATVTAFKFTLLVAAAVQYPNGWIEVVAGDSSVRATDVYNIAGVVRSVVGTVDTSVTVTWTTSDAGTATIANNGRVGGTQSYLAAVTGVRGGTATMTATDGVRTGTLLMTVTGIVRTWTGAVSTDWSNGGNWNPVNVIPAPVDSVLIPTGVPNFPVLTSAVSIGGVQVADAATLSLGAFDLSVTANLATGFTVGSGVLATTGILRLAGNGTVQGRVPSTLVTGTYSLSNNLFVVAPQSVDLGTLTADIFELQVVAQ
ncbi:MAG TPA: hypothetical protein VF771_02405 [Longimicrobiaceae bacterium]